MSVRLRVVPVPDLPWLVYAMLLAPLGLILFAAGTNICRSAPPASGRRRRARSWSRARKCAKSRCSTTAAKTGFRIEPRNFANIVYEYTVSGQKLTNNRVSIGEDRGNFEVAETIARYPVGTAVTVYYNSRHPREAVLERDMPKGMWGCLAIGTAVVLAIVFGGVFGINLFNDFVSRIWPIRGCRRWSCARAFGVVIALFALALHRQASLAKKWPVVPGTIQMSDVEPYRAAPSESGSRGPVMYQRQVSYAYRYNNVAYSSIQGSLATGINSRSGWLVRKFTPAYQDGAGVKVYVNPLNPSEATLDPAHLCLSGCRRFSSSEFAGSPYYAAIVTASINYSLRPQRVSISPNIRASRSAHCSSPA